MWIIIYQQNTEKRAKSQFGCIKKLLDAIPEGLVKEVINTHINTAKIIALIGAMDTDNLLFKLMYEVYRIKLNMDEDALKDADLNMFFNRKIEQSNVIAGWYDTAIKKLKQTYCKYMQAAGLLQEPVKNERKINRPYKITSIEVRLDFMQMEPVSDTKKPRQLVAFFVDTNGNKISYDVSLIAKCKRHRCKKTCDE